MNYFHYADPPPDGAAPLAARTEVGPCPRLCGAAREAAGDPRAAAADHRRALLINQTLLGQATELQ